MKKADIGNSAMPDCAYGVTKRRQGESTVTDTTGTKKRRMRDTSRNALNRAFVLLADHHLPKPMKTWPSARTAGSDSLPGGKYCNF